MTGQQIGQVFLIMAAVFILMETIDWIIFYLKNKN